MQYALFEDTLSVRLNPLVRLMQVFELRCGILTLRHKFELMLESPAASLFTRPSLAPLTSRQNPITPVNELPVAPLLLLNGRWIPDAPILKQFEELTPGSMVLNKGTVVAACIDDTHGEQFMPGSEGWDFYPDETWQIIEMDEGLQLLDFSWDIGRYNSLQIKTDINLLMPDRGRRDFMGVYFLHDENIFIAPGAEVKPGVVIDASNGPVFLGPGSVVMPTCSLEGPLAVGANSVVNAGARIYGGTTIGPDCKVGGEISGSVFHSNSNKQHAGFLGHAVIGRWVNLGAGTSNSNMKNNYGKVRSFANGEPVNTGLQFAGITIADYTKTGINSMFNAGTVTGIMCNLFGAGFPPANIPDFSWGGADGFEVYRADKGIDAARREMKRRGLVLADEEERLILRVYNELVG